MTYANKASAQDAHMVKPYDWDLMRLLYSAASSPKTFLSRAGLPRSAGRSPLSLLLLLSLPVRLSSLLLLLLLPLMQPKSVLLGETNSVGGLSSAPLRPRHQVLPLVPRALRAVSGATHPS